MRGLPRPVGVGVVTAPLLTIPEVAARLKVSVRTVRAWIAARRLAVVRLGPRCVRVEPTEVERLLEEARR
ncbi:MAG: helix-turn-helix domain-containing protein [Planctomycetes bacterium]|nr:helix-turn-helix domain-containing protein [Planctomycetota bacterium]